MKTSAFLCVMGNGGRGGKRSGSKGGTGEKRVTLAEFQKMSFNEMADFLVDVVDKIDLGAEYYNRSLEQKLIAYLGMDDKPTVMSDKQFDAAHGNDDFVLYRTVNAGGGLTAVDICDDTMTGDKSHIGNGVYGNGYYYSNWRDGSEVYGYESNNIRRTAVMTGALNSKARLVNWADIDTEATNWYSDNFHGNTKMRNNNSYVLAYAIKKGYNGE